MKIKIIKCYLTQRIGIVICSFHIFNSSYMFIRSLFSSKTLSEKHSWKAPISKQDNNLLKVKKKLKII